MKENEAPRLALLALGCKTNQYENDALAASFAERGFRLVDWADDLEVVILNTCTVTQEAGRRSLQLLRRLRRRHPDALIVASGCHVPYANVSELADLVLGTTGRDKIVAAVEARLRGEAVDRDLTRDDYVYEELAAVARPSETRAWLKIEDGCDNHCTYCAIRLARGPVRSRAQDRVLAEARALWAAGYREIVLTGTQIAAYGRGRGERGSLADLLKELDREYPGRIRLGSLAPTALDEELLSVLASARRICPHLHLSLQSGSADVLSRMGRPYDAEIINQILTRVRAFWPEAGFTADFISGFPGESQKNHEETLALIEAHAWVNLHIFRFSARPGTAAARFPDQLPAAEVRRRAAELEEGAREKRRQAIEERLGRRRELLVERLVAGRAFGHSEDYLSLGLEGGAVDLTAGQVLPVLLTGREGDLALARPLANDLQV